jgi:hypothetical protein
MNFFYWPKIAPILEMETTLTWLNTLPASDKEKLETYVNSIDRSKEKEVVLVHNRYSIDRWEFLLRLLAGTPLYSASIDTPEAYISRTETHLGKMGQSPPEWLPVDGFYMEEKGFLKGFRLKPTKEDLLDAVVVALLLDLDMKSLGFPPEDIAKILCDPFRRGDMKTRVRMLRLPKEGREPDFKIPCHEKINAFIQKAFAGPVVKIASQRPQTIYFQYDGCFFHSFFILETGQSFFMTDFSIKDFVKTTKSDDTTIDGDMVYFKKRETSLPITTASEIFRYILSHEASSVCFKLE